MSYSNLGKVPLMFFSDGKKYIRTLPCLVTDLSLFTVIWLHTITLCDLTGHYLMDTRRLETSYILINLRKCLFLSLIKLELICLFS